MDRGKQHIEFEHKINKLILASSAKPLVIIFTANWVSTSSIVDIVIQKLIDHTADINILQVDIDTYEILAQKYRIDSVPTTLIIFEDELKYRFTGVFSKKKVIDLIEAL